jgi:hypothetical protein
VCDTPLLAARPDVGSISGVTAYRRPCLLWFNPIGMLGLRALQAVGGRDAPGLLPLMRFLVRHVGNPRYSAMCVAMAHKVMDLYCPLIGRVMGTSWAKKPKACVHQHEVRVNPTTQLGPSLG